MGQVNPLQDVVDKRVYDAHGHGGDAMCRGRSVCEGLVDVRIWHRILLLPPPLLALLLVTLGDGFLGLCEGLLDVSSWHRTPLLALLLATLGDGFLDLCEGLLDVHR